MECCHGGCEKEQDLKLEASILTQPLRAVYNNSMDSLESLKFLTCEKQIEVIRILTCKSNNLH